MNLLSYALNFGMLIRKKTIVVEEIEVGKTKDIVLILVDKPKI